MPALKGAAIYAGLALACAYTAVSLGVLSGLYWQSFRAGIENRRQIR
jgi:hypothetical protein